MRVLSVASASLLYYSRYGTFRKQCAVGMWLILMSREEHRRWMMTLSDIVRYTCVVEQRKRWLERWRLCGRSAQESGVGGEKVGWESEQVGHTTLLKRGE